MAGPAALMLPHKHPLPLTYSAGPEGQQQHTAGWPQQPAGKQIRVHIAQLVDQLLNIRDQHLMAAAGEADMHTTGKKMRCRQAANWQHVRNCCLHDCCSTTTHSLPVGNPSGVSADQHTPSQTTLSNHHGGPRSSTAQVRTPHGSPCRTLCTNPAHLLLVCL